MLQTLHLDPISFTNLVRYSLEFAITVIVLIEFGCSFKFLDGTLSYLGGETNYPA